MVSPILIAIGAGVFVVWLWRRIFHRPPNFAPGLPNLPLLGSYPIILLVDYWHLHRALTTIARFYKTNVLGFFYAGGIPCMTIHDLTTTREMLQNPDLDGRPVFEMVRARDPHDEVWGIFFRDGQFWKEQRRFTLRHLRDYGFGRRFDELELHIAEELHSFVDMVRNGPIYEHEKSLVSGNGLVRSVPLALAAPPANALLKCITNECLPRPEMHVLYAAARAGLHFTRNGCIFGRLFSMIESLTWLAPNRSGYRAVRDGSLQLYEIVWQIVERQYASRDAEHERNFLDLYFREMMTGDSDEAANKDQLKQITHTVIDLMLPTMTGLPATVSFVLQRLQLNPACMQRVQSDLDAVVGRSRLPSLDDRMRLPYLEAVLRETMRLDTLVSLNLPHRAIRDTKIGGYDLPAGGLVLAVLESAHQDDKFFKDAHQFRPERFLGPDGKLDLAKDQTVPFGAGKRLCAGETFARNMAFLFVGAIVQNFNLQAVNGERILDPGRDANIGLIKMMPEYQLRFVSR